MELIKVNSLKLKIILTAEDMKSLGISCESADYSNAETKTAIKNILDIAKEETGFDTKKDCIYISLFPSVDGGCEIFLTRKYDLLSDESETKSTDSFLTKKYKVSYDISQTDKKRTYIAESEIFDDIAEMCVRMKKHKFSGGSSLYFDKNRYFLLIAFNKTRPAFLKEERMPSEHHKFYFINDYAEVYIATDIIKLYLSEHAKTLVENGAVDIIAEKFGKVV